MKRKNLSRANSIDEKLKNLEELKKVLDNYSIDQKKEQGFFSYWLPFPIHLKHNDLEIDIDDSVEGKIIKEVIIDYINNKINELENEFSKL